MIEIGAVELVVWWLGFVSLVVAALSIFIYFAVIIVGRTTGRWLISDDKMGSLVFVFCLTGMCFIFWGVQICFIGIDLGRIVIWPY